MMSRGRIPIVLDVAPNARTLTFAAAVTIVTAVLFGLLPAFGASRPDVQAGLKLGASGIDRTRNRWGRAMMAAQVALLVLLLTSAGLFARTLHKLRAIDVGFQHDQVLVVSVSTGSEYRGAGARVLYDELYRRFATLAAVRAVSLSMDTPLAGELSMGAGISVPGRPPDPDDAPAVYHNFVGPRFFETMGMPLIAGRDFEPGDDARAPRRVVISESVARRYFPGQDPLGREVGFGASTASIVGVARDVRYTSVHAEAPLMLYRSYRQENNAPANTFLIRTSSTPEVLRPLLQAEVRAAAPGLPPPSVVRSEDQVDASLIEERMLAMLSSAIGLLAAILAAIGIYSTVASAVARRQREIGIRIALGALPRQIVRVVVTEAFATVGIGLAFGIPAALAAGRAARGIVADVLFELSPTDPLMLSGAVIAILMIATLAAYVPVRRASRIDPVAAIKAS